MIIGVIGFWILGVVAAALSRVFADEFKAWMPWFTKWLIRRAIDRLPEDQRERYREEWSSDIEETPGDIGKTFKSVGFVQAAHRRSSEMAKKRPRIFVADSHMSPTHPEWAAFCDALAREVFGDFEDVEAGKFSSHCQHDHRRTRSLLVNKWPQVDVEATLKLFREHGGFCDCEVLLNVDSGQDVDDMAIEEAQGRWVATEGISVLMDPAGFWFSAHSRCLLWRTIS